jgi:hypothetical protein
VPGTRARHRASRTIPGMALASLGSTLVGAAGMVVVLAMASLLLYRGSRTRAEDEDPGDADE